MSDVICCTPTLNWPSGKGVTAVTTTIRVQFMVGGTIYNAWVPLKEVKPPFLKVE